AGGGGPGRGVHDLEGRSALHLQSAPERHVPRRHALQRGGREVLHRAADRSRAPGQQARQVSFRQLFLRQREGGGGRRRLHGGVRVEGAARVVPDDPHGGGGLDRQPDGREEARRRLRAATRRKGAVQVRGVGARREGGAGG